MDHLCLKLEAMKKTGHSSSLAKETKHSDADFILIFYQKNKFAPQNECSRNMYSAWFSSLPWLGYLFCASSEGTEPQPHPRKVENFSEIEVTGALSFRAESIGETNTKH